MAFKILPSQEILLQLLRYDPASGKLTWKDRDVSWFNSTGRMKPAQVCKTWNMRYANTAAINSADKQGYLCGAILGESAKAHRVIWKMVHGTDAEQVDHINGVTNDNRLENLRSVSQVENSRNMRVYADNHSGVFGVVWHKRIAKWAAQIKVNQAPLHLGYFDLFWDAVAARKEAEVKYGFHDNHGRLD